MNTNIYLANFNIKEILSTYEVIISNLSINTDELIMANSGKNNQSDLSLFRKKVSFLVELNQIIFIKYDISKNIYIRLDDNGEEETHTIAIDDWHNGIYPPDLPVADGLLLRLF